MATCLLIYDGCRICISIFDLGLYLPSFEDLKDGDADIWSHKLSLLKILRMVMRIFGPHKLSRYVQNG